MKFVSLIVFVIVQILFIPFAIIGGILTAIKQLAVSKKLGVSGTAISVIAGRWVMNIYGTRKDMNTARLYGALPNGSVFGLWMLFFPRYLRYKISPSSEKEGMESMLNVAATRTFLFDKLIDKSIDNIEQFIIMGAGYDTRGYGFYKNKKIRYFELDQQNTQKLKIECLKKAGIDSSQVVFVDVDFSSEKWFEKLEHAGYDPAKKSIFLWEGVTLYLSESNVRKTIKEIKEHAAAGSKLLADVYAKRLIALQGVKATNEGFNFGLDFSSDYENTLRSFIESENAKLGDHHFMGYKNKKGPFGVVLEINLSD
jgi:methyltransferase (TIGR00027 family)